MEIGLLRLDARGGFDEPLDAVLGLDGSGEVAVAVVTRLEEQFPDPGIVLEEAAEPVDLGNGDAAVQVGPDIMRLGRRAVIDIAADVEVEVFLLQAPRRTHPGSISPPPDGCGRRG